MSKFIHDSGEAQFITPRHMQKWRVHYERARPVWMSVMAANRVQKTSAAIIGSRCLNLRMNSGKKTTAETRARRAKTAALRAREITGFSWNYAFVEPANPVHLNDRQVFWVHARHAGRRIKSRITAGRRLVVLQFYHSICTGVEANTGCASAEQK